MLVDRARGVNLAHVRFINLLYKDIQLVISQDSQLTLIMFVLRDFRMLAKYFCNGVFQEMFLPLSNLKTAFSLLFL